jgi:hypothetical protein
LASQDPDLVRPQAAVRRVAGAPQLQGRSVHLRQARKGAAPEARPHRRRRQEGRRQVLVAVAQGQGKALEQVLSS